MKTVQLVKQLNNTELGKGGTHDTYVLIPNELDIQDIFENPNVKIKFFDPDIRENVVVRYTKGREKRIVGLGEYYRKKYMSAGDEIVFEKRTINCNDVYRIRTIKHQDIIVFQKSKAGFEILTPDRMELVKLWNVHIDNTFSINFICSTKKRNDSPNTTDFYDIIVEGKSILANYSGKDIGILFVKDNKIRIKSFYGWKKYSFITEE